MRKIMNNTIYTFWEGKMPDYLKMCMNTWHFPFVVLNYKNVDQYTIQLPEKLKRLTLPKIADFVRVHVLRDNGGYWLDTDTIMLTDKLPDECILGSDNNRTNTIGYLHTEKNSEMFKTWAVYQEITLDRLQISTFDNTKWDIMGNSFTDTYLVEHKEIKIGDISKNWPETYMITDDIQRPQKYKKFYFESNIQFSDIREKPSMFMLHNSWTPAWYKGLDKAKVLSTKCTLSNILRECCNK